MNKTWELKWNLRWDRRAYQASTEYFGGGTVTKHHSVLQQAFQCVETGEVEWRDVPTVVRASQGESAETNAPEQAKESFAEKFNKPMDAARRARKGEEVR